MITTITLNPSIDRTLGIKELKRGEVNRAELIQIDAAGKGVNVSRALAAYGVSTHAILVGAQLGSEWFAEQLRAQNIEHTMVMAPGILRSNLTLVESDGIVTKINEPGVEMRPEILAAVEGALDSLPIEGNWVVFAGRLNPGADVDTYRRLVQFAKSRGAKVALDASGAALAAAITENGPDLIKPNQHELGGIVKKEPETIAEVIEVAREVMARGVGAVLCSLGKDGAILINEEGVIHAEAAEDIQGTPVGAGDILLGSFLAGGANAAALPGAIQWSAASVSLPGTGIPTPAQAAAIKVIVNNNVDSARELVEVG
jgi:1-phosphofructokinase